MFLFFILVSNVSVSVFTIECFLLILSENRKYSLRTQRTERKCTAFLLPIFFSFFWFVFVRSFSSSHSLCVPASRANYCAVNVCRVTLAYSSISISTNLSFVVCLLFIFQANCARALCCLCVSMRCAPCLHSMTSASSAVFAFFIFYFLRLSMLSGRLLQSSVKNTLFSHLIDFRCSCR